MSRKAVHVAVGVIVDGTRILLAKRLEHSHQGGLWEFPGGKVEAGESVEQALSRELQEELAIRVVRAEPLLQVTHDYGDKSVMLDVWWVDRFEGEAEGCEGQTIAWVEAKSLGDYAFPAANQLIVEAVVQRLAKSVLPAGVAQ